MKIYTRTGDSGSTGLFGGPRVPKDDRRIEAYGTVDELNATIGLVRAASVTPQVDSQLELIQHELFSIGAELATPNPDSHAMRIIGASHVEQLEKWIDQYENQLPELKNFILPAGDLATSSTHLARSICRRAERRVVTLAGEMEGTESPISKELIEYLNRLSDFLFVLARALNQIAGNAETAWKRPRE